MESLAVASHPLQDLNRQGGSGEPPLPKIISSKEKRREDFSSRRWVLWGQSCLRRYFVPKVKLMVPTFRLMWYE